MDRGLGARGEKAIKDAVKRFPDPQSDMHRRIKRSLQGLDRTIKELKQCIAARAAMQIDDEIRKRATALAKAEALVTSARSDRRRLQTVKDERIARTAEVLQESAEALLGVVKEASDARTSVIVRGNAIESEMWGWLDSVVEYAVKALWSDAAAVAAVGTISGGLIVAGAVGAPAVIMAATIASGAMWLHDLHAGISKTSQMSREDRAAARGERGLRLIEYATSVASQWLAILCKRPMGARQSGTRPPRP